MVSDAREWYADGLRFECTQCGNCCTGPPGAVWFEPEEGRALAAALGIDHDVFLRDYARELPEGWSLKEHETEHGYDCIFLDRETIPGKAVCGVYHNRPTQCRTWPFWPENVASPRAWATTKRTTPCPGMDRGKIVPIEAIRIQRDASPAFWLEPRS